MFPCFPGVYARGAARTGVWGDIHFDVPAAGCGVLLAGVLLVVLVVGIVHDVLTGQWVARIPEYLVPLAVLCVLTVLWWRARRRPE